jgi:hypothetical protein
MEARKHRLEQKHFAHEFAAQLAEGDSLSGTPTVKLIRQGADVTTEFGSPSPSISGTRVVFTLEEAAGGEQDSGNYVLLIEVDTAAGEHLLAEVQDARSGEFRRPLLRVYEDGDLSAP